MQTLRTRHHVARSNSLRRAIVALVLMPTGLMRHYARAQDGYMEMAWSSDHGETFGPDGPWQAVLARVGGGSDNGSSSVSDDDANLYPFWPTDLGWKTCVYTPALGGRYNTSSPLNAPYATKNNGTLVMEDPTGSELGGLVYIERVEPRVKKVGVEAEKKNPPLPSAKLSLSPLDKEQLSRGAVAGRRGTSRNPVGMLGFGPSSLRPMTASLLSQLRAADHIRSESFGLHMGSVALGQKGSMVLGGYDRTRALGKVAAFNRGGVTYFTVFLLDVLLGVETGASPFQGLEDPANATATTTTSVFQGIHRNSVWAREAVQSGGKQGSVKVVLAPEWAYIGLPETVCEAAAKHLPVALDRRLNLYIWNTSDPRFERIVTSPATLGFVFSDKEGQNVTVKVPFRLLNLTLEAPLVNGTKLQYFPCWPVTELSFVYGLYLGRAFFQAAFWAINYERDTAFLAQAPGPNLGQAIVTSIPPDATTIPTTTDLDAFAKTWEGHWTPLPIANSTVGDCSPPSPQPPPSGLATGAIVGIIGGAAAVALATAAAAVFLRRRRRERAANGGDIAGQSGYGDSAHGLASPSQVQVQIQAQGPVELWGKTPAGEVGPPLPHETDGRAVAWYFELPNGTEQARG